jgi:hypothetical protein
MSFVRLTVIATSACSTVAPSRVIGLRPESPPPGDVDGTSFVLVETTRPTFRWESFPTRADAERDPAWASRLKNVAYDLAVYRARRGAPAEVVYSRQALPEPSHVIVEPLPAGARYFWTVRARFVIDGQVRVTEWSVIQPRRVMPNGPVSRLPVVPSEFYFRFETP